MSIDDKLITRDIACQWGLCWDPVRVNAMFQIADPLPLMTVLGSSQLMLIEKLWVACRALAWWDEMSIVQNWTSPDPRAPTWYWPFIQAMNTNTVQSTIDQIVSILSA